MEVRMQRKKNVREEEKEEEKRQRRRSRRHGKMENENGRKGVRNE